MRRTSEAGTVIAGAGTSAREHASARARAVPPRSDDCEEFVRAVYHHHATHLLRYAARLLGGDWHKAEDVLQEATARAWKHFAPATADPVSVRPWLFTVVRNLAIDHHRARLVRPVEVQTVDDLDLSVDDAVEHILTGQIVLDALNRLPPTHRDVITLVYFRGHSVSEAADVLGIPPGTVKSRSYYALRALRDILHAHGVVRP
ncbi:sigma-70 family RNA polymerase sigma factor [Streptomyces sp. NPDC090445]|uniref:sigma-70 family RNA polymerase sigma factor n=1 Tax=Streptomyces sp. NPDC090445 TaxID=3365963 RepID=UPI0038267E68